MSKKLTKEETLNRYGDTELHFKSWYKNDWLFTSLDKKHTAAGTAYYRSDVYPVMTLNELIKEGFEYLYFDGVKIDELE